MLALICGSGALPAAVAGAQEAPPFVAALEGFLPDGLTPDVTFRLERLGNLLSDLTARGVTTLCLCGAITRPAIDPARITPETMPFVPTLQAAIAAGDDGALRAVIGIFETAGFAVLGAHVLAPDLLPPEGVLTWAALPGDVRDQLGMARAALAEMGRRDVGQACVLRGGAVIAREEQDGTDAMLERLARTGAKGGFLFKGPKPDQDRRADLPAIGLGTVEAALRAGLEGIVIEAGAVMVLDRDVVIGALDTAGAFLWVVRA